MLLRPLFTLIILRPSTTTLSLLFEPLLVTSCNKLTQSFNSLYFSPHFTIPPLLYHFSLLLPLSHSSVPPQIALQLIWHFLPVTIVSSWTAPSPTLIIFPWTMYLRILLFPPFTPLLLHRLLYLTTIAPLLSPPTLLLSHDSHLCPFTSTSLLSLYLLLSPLKLLFHSWI